MKKVLIILSAAVLAAALCACSGDNTAGNGTTEQTSAAVSQKPQESAPANTADDEAVKALAKELTGTWANQEDYTERYVFADDLGFIRYMGGKTYSGRLTLGEGDILGMTFDDADIAPATYSRVPSAEEADDSSWYLGDGHLVLGGRKLVKTLDY